MNIIESMDFVDWLLVNFIVAILFSAAIGRFLHMTDNKDNDIGRD